VSTSGEGGALRWPTCAALPASAPDGDWVWAASTDLMHDRRTVLGDTEAGLTCDPVVGYDDGTDWLAVRVWAEDPEVYREVRLSPSVIRRAVKSPDVSPLTLLACALAVPSGELGSGWRPKRVGGALPMPERLLEDQSDLFRWTDAAGRIGAALAEGKDILVTGDHGSGKTCMAAHFAQLHQETNGGLIWLDLSDPADGAESILATLLSTEASKHYLLVVDGVQANVTVIESVLGCVTRLRSDFQITIQVLATGWGSVRERLPESFRHMVRFTVQGSDLIEILLSERNLTHGDRQRLRALAKDDVHIARTALKLYRPGQVPTSRDLEVEYTEGVDDDEMRQAFYWCASLAFFEIDVSRATAERMFGDALERLRAAHRIVYSDSSLTVGPRARAALILRHAHNQWRADQRWGRPSDITWRYLQSHDDLLIKAMLGRLDLGTQRAGLRYSTRYLLIAWDLLGQLQRQLEKDSEKDPERGDLVGNAAFTAIALARLGSREAWTKVVDRLRSRWIYHTPPELPKTGDGVESKDFCQFSQIKSEMRAEDATLGAAPHLAGQRAEDIDLETFYRTWVLGLMLGVEGRAPVPDQERIQNLYMIAKTAQDPVGYFYPRRVPWNTARVVMGLVAAGFDHTDEVVRQACAWLTRSVRDGGAFSDEDGYWHSGTGTWNTDEATTAMCLIALAQAKAPRGAVRDLAHAWLAGQQACWTARDREIDLAQVLEALLQDPDDQENLFPLVERLLYRVSMALDGRDPMDQDVPEDTHRIPFVTAQLASIVWVTVIREFTKLLEDLTDIDFGSDSVQPGFPAAENQFAPHEPARAETVRRPSLSLRPDQLARWRDAASTLRQTLTEGIASRAAALENTPKLAGVREKMNQLQAQRDVAVRLTDQLGDATPPAVLAELNDLGRLVCGPAWPELPMPNENADPWR